MGTNKHMRNESASFNVPEKKERQKSNYEEFITKLLGKVILTKETFFGLDVQKIVIIVTPSFKIAAVVSNNKKLLGRFPQKKQDILNPEEVISWANENGFEITFVAPTPQLKSRLHILIKFTHSLTEIADFVQVSTFTEQHLDVFQVVVK